MFGLMWRVFFTFFAKLTDDELSWCTPFWPLLKRPMRPYFDGELGGLGAGNALGESNSCGGRVGRFRWRSRLFVPRAGCVGALGTEMSASVRVLRTLVSLFHILCVVLVCSAAWTETSREQQSGDASWMQLSSGPCGLGSAGGLEKNRSTTSSGHGER